MNILAEQGVKLGDIVNEICFLSDIESLESRVSKKLDFRLATERS